MKATREFWVWFFQRLSGVLSVVLLGIHFWVTHFANLGEKIVFVGVQMRLSSFIFLSVDFLLLLLVVLHGLNGLRTVLLDFRFGQENIKFITWTLILVGILTFLFGVQVLQAFLR
ncbi:MAG: hypothetical protein ACE5K0_02775 [Candidatus Methanofastidiosia archaeon]